MSGMKNKHILHRRWAITIVALMGSGFFSPIGMRLLDYFEIKTPFSDIILTTILILIACVVYRLIFKYRIKGDE
jgi:membrane protein YdbS with pleckstrin-like domain